MNLPLITSLLEGSWTIHNLQGVPKKFADASSHAAREWMSNRDGPSRPHRLTDYEKNKRQQDKEDRAAEKAARLTPHEIYDKVTDIIGDSFPDGDPIDMVGPWMDKNDLNMDDINKVFKKIERTTMYGYVARMWEQMAQDSLHDANVLLKKGKEPNDSPFYSVKDGKAELTDNPWYTAAEQKKARR